MFIQINQCPFNFAKKKDNFKHFSGKEKDQMQADDHHQGVSTHESHRALCLQAPRGPVPPAQGPLLHLCLCAPFVFDGSQWSQRIWHLYHTISEIPLFFYLGDSQNMPHDSTLTSVLWGYIVSDILYLYMNDFTLTLNSTFSG